MIQIAAIRLRRAASLKLMTIPLSSAQPIAADASMRGSVTSKRFPNLDWETR
jgi:hypothetical protein